ncbi:MULTISPECIES: hypothetical protein [unclassified Minwuia]|jgi:hypothetical protein|uniref:hypothetical protein n=1 Tax=unclassified Minwuia TaxID=2618799 RepID=UPI002479EB1C|nr:MULTISPECIES: hypothetical protein [unclassified Minwuia]
MFEYIDGYCERIAPGLLGEPLNAITNLAFMFAALWLWRIARRHHRDRSWMLRTLVFLLFATGVCSLIFHSFANVIGVILDTLALTLCLLAAFLFSARVWLHQGWWTAALWPVGMIVAALVLGGIVPVDGAAYLGPFVTGALLAGILILRGHPAGKDVAIGVACFVPSFFFRSIDAPVCEAFPDGTHFLWHILNACVLGFAILPFARLDPRRLPPR